MPWGFKEARLRFVEPVSISFDTFPDYIFHEVVPFIWDCWDCHFEKTAAFFKRHKVRTAIFTASQSADRMRRRFPQMNILHMPEGIDASAYLPGKPLAERGIDLLEYGRSNGLDIRLSLNRRHARPVKGRCQFPSHRQLADTLADAKVAIALPRSITQPQLAASVETLTQRYWECMLSRTVLAGHAPRELVDLVGYNPVIELDMSNPSAHIEDILAHITDYQELADRNRQAALRHGDWKVRMQQLMIALQALGYETK